MEFFKVIVVGGGAAGLAAAHALAEKVDFVLLEGNDYLGGRIRTVDADESSTVDLGAQYIHGEKNNLVYSICSTLDCVLPEKNRKILVATSDKKTIEPAVFNQISAIWEEFLYDARAKFELDATPKSTSFADFFREDFCNRLESFTPEIRAAAIVYFEQFELIENGCSSLDKLSLKEYGTFEYLDGSYDTEFRNGGYRPLIKYLTSFIKDPKRIRLESEVFRVEFVESIGRIQIQVRDLKLSTTYSMQCEHLIWTSSLGFLKENFRSIFCAERTLISEKEKSIENLGFDTVNKIVLIYEKPFWPQDLSEIIIFHTDDQYLPSICTSIDESILRLIVRSIHRFDVLPSSRLPILICWFGGPAAVSSEDLSSNLIGEICHQVLCDFLAVSSRINEPKRILRSNWKTNRFVRGSYTYHTLDSTTEHIETLGKPYAPDGIPRILFAGEATHERFYSSVHGALESGYRQAKRIISMSEV